MTQRLQRLLRQPRERRLALLAAVIIGCWMALTLVVQPLWDLGGTIAARVHAQRQKLDAVARVLAQSQTVTERARQYALLLMPEAASGGAPAALLGELESLSRTSNVALNLKPRPAVREGRMSRMEVELDLEGSQSGLLNFLDALLRMPRLLTVERLRISTIPAKPDVLRANLVLSHLAWLR